MPTATFRPSKLVFANHADIAQPVEQRFRKLPRSIQPAITKNDAKRRIDGRQALYPSPRTPVHLYAYSARSRRGFFWVTELLGELNLWLPDQESSKISFFFNTAGNLCGTNALPPDAERVVGKA